MILVFCFVAFSFSVLSRVHDSQILALSMEWRPWRARALGVLVPLVCSRPRFIPPPSLHSGSNIDAFWDATCVLLVCFVACVLFVLSRCPCLLCHVLFVLSHSACLFVAIMVVFVLSCFVSFVSELVAWSLHACVHLHTRACLND